MKSMMKILLLNPQIDAEHNLLKTLQDRGYTVLCSISAREALQLLKLHASSTDLLIIHREGFLDTGGKPNQEAGLKFLTQVKKDKATSEVPVVLTSEAWTDADCARHQQTAEGANAYLKWPTPSAVVLKTIDEIFQNSMSSSAVVSLEISPSTTGSMSYASSPAPQDGMLLESASQIFDTAPREKSDSGISLELPDNPPSEKAPEPIALDLSQGLPVSTGSFSMPTDAQADGTIALSQGLVQSQTTNATIAIPASLIVGPTGAPVEATRSGMADFVKTRVQITSSAQGAGHSEAPEISIPSGFTLSPTLGPSGSGSDFDNEPRVHLSSRMEDFPSEPKPPAPEEPIGEFKDEQAFRDMPYLFGGKEPVKTFGGGALPSQVNSVLSFFHPVDDAVVPGGVAQAPDVETLKKYLMLREQDVAVLSNQLKTMREQVAALEETIQQEKGKNTELSFTIAEHQRRIENFEKEKSSAIEQSQNELNDVRFELKVKTDKAKVMESQLREAISETEKIKDRVRMDIRKIRVREKELENRLEIVKRDSEALLAARETKIIELKRKLDLLEFNMDLLQDQYSSEKGNSARLSERLERAAQVLRVAGGLLDAQTQGFSGEALAETLGEKLSDHSVPNAGMKANRRAS